MLAPLHQLTTSRANRFRTVVACQSPPRAPAQPALSGSTVRDNDGVAVSLNDDSAMDAAPFQHQEYGASFAATLFTGTQLDGERLALPPCQ
jgi:hypothetical protein